MKKQYTVVLAVIVVAVLAMGIAYSRQQQKAQDIADDSSIRTLITQFGSNIQKVSLSAPDALNEIANSYAPYASSSLITYWQNNRAFAPGKGLSSPWPDRIEVSAVTKTADGSYVVKGTVIEVTSQEVTHGGIAAQFPVTMTFKKYGNQWLMTGYEPGPVQTFATASTTVQQ